jgi:pathogenesis-related protein 1
MAMARPNQSSVVNKKVSCSDARNQLTKAEVDEILRIHNQARAQVGVSPLTWNCQLAKEAQTWVDKGVYKHSSTSFGENLASSAPGNGAIATKGSMLWLNEKKYWNNKAATCQPGQQCGHYTQMVWKKTTQIGCGLNRKASVFPGFERNSAYLTCLYYPAGKYHGPAY